MTRRMCILSTFKIHLNQIIQEVSVVNYAGRRTWCHCALILALH